MTPNFFFKRLILFTKIETPKPIKLFRKRIMILGKILGGKFILPIVICENFSMGKMSFVLVGKRVLSQKVLIRFSFYT